MLISENNTERTFKLVPPGSHMAICYGFVDLGTQDYFYQGEPKKARMCRIMWELHGEDADGNPLTLDDGRPLSISAKYTISLHENAKLRIMLKSWRNKDFTEAERRGYDIRTILGQHCMITVEHRTKDDKTFANVGAVTGVPAALRKLGLPDQVNKRTYFSFGYYDQSEFDALTDGLKKIIMQSPEWEARQQIAKPARVDPFDDDDSIPF
jgi:hypothetical protein